MKYVSYAFQPFGFSCPSPCCFGFFNLFSPVHEEIAKSSHPLYLFEMVPLLFVIVFFG